MISLKNLAYKLKMTRPALNYRMLKIKNFKSKYTKIIHNQRYVSDKGVKLLSYHKHNSTSGSMHVRHGSSKWQMNRQELISLVKSQQRTIESQQGTITKLSSQLTKPNQKAISGQKISFWSKLKLAFHRK